MTTVSRSLRRALLLICGSAATLNAQSLIKDLDPGFGSSTPRSFAPIAGAALFYANTGAHGVELWRSDGTATGTTVLDLNPGQASGAVQNEPPARLGDRALIFGDDGQRGGLFLTDATRVGTQFVAALRMASGQAATDARRMVGLGDRIVMTASTAANEGALFVSDGTPGGTRRLATLSAPFPGDAGGHDGTAWFVTSNLSGHSELWKTDGTPTGTRLAAASPSSRSFAGLAVPGPRHVLLIEQGYPGGQPPRLVLYDEPANSLVPVQGVPPNAPVRVAALPNAGGPFGTGIAALADVQGNVIIVGVDPVTRSATVLRNLGERAPKLYEAHDQVWIVTTQPFARIWRTDGTAGGTVPVWPPAAGPFVGSIGELYPIGANRMLFTAITTGVGLEPWTTDGTRTRLAANVAAGTQWQAAPGFTLVPDLGSGGTIFMSVRDSSFGTELWAMPARLGGAGVLEPVRASCAPAAHRIELVSPPPTSGNTAFHLQLRSNGANAAAALWFGASLRTGPPACLPPLVVTDSAGITTDASGRATLPLPIPTDPALIGARLFVVGGVARPGGSFAGLADFTDVHALIIGE